MPVTSVWWIAPCFSYTFCSSPLLRRCSQRSFGGGHHFLVSYLHALLPRQRLGTSTLASALPGTRRLLGACRGGLRPISRSGAPALHPYLRLTPEVLLTSMSRHHFWGLWIDGSANDFTSSLGTVLPPIRASCV